MNFVCSVNFNFGYNTFVDCAREYISAVVVRVLSDKIDTACRCEHFTICTIQDFEFFLNFGFHLHILCVLIIFPVSNRSPQ